MSKVDVKAIALGWAKGQLEDPDYMDVLEYADGAFGVDLTPDQTDELIAAIGDLVVAPRTEVPKAYAWKTVISGRYPEVKLHKTRAAARSAFSAYGWYARRGQLFELQQDNNWHLLFENQDNRLKCDDLPWRKK